jgi:hypothetical protein
MGKKHVMIVQNLLGVYYGTGRFMRKLLAKKSLRSM